MVSSNIIRVEDSGFSWDVFSNEVELVQSNHEQNILDKIDSFEGSCFIDVGAHVGWWSLRASKAFKSVISFEPHPETADLLETNIKLNNISNINVSRYALGNYDGNADFYVYGDRHALSSINNFRLDWPFWKKTSVPIRRLDSFDLKTDFLKIDVEGAEQEVLDGATNTIKKHHPRILLEQHDRKNCEKFLRDFGYEVVGIGEHLYAKISNL